jgi:hypothetical protein
MRPEAKLDILAALRREEVRFEREVNAAKHQLETVRAAIKLMGSKARRRTRKMSAAARAKISKAQKLRWSKVRASKAKTKS